MKYLFLILGFFIVENLSAQLTLNLGKNVYYKATVEFEDGTIKEGFVLSFDDKRAYYYDTTQYELLFASPEHNSGFTKEYYTFRQNEESKDEKIYFADIKKMTVKESFLSSNKFMTVHYEKVKIAKPNNELGIDLWENEVFLPIFYSNSKITIYSYFQFNGYNFYFLPTGADYAVKPFEITTGTIFTMKKIGPKILAAFEFMGKDCPLFLEHLNSRKSKYDENFGKTIGKEFSKAQAVEQDLYNKDLKKAKKSMPKEDFKKYEIDKKYEKLQRQNEQFYDAIFNEEVMDYINSCE